MLINFIFFLGLVCFFGLCCILCAGVFYKATNSKTFGVIFWEWIHNFIAHSLLCTFFPAAETFHNWTIKKWQEQEARTDD